MKPCECWLRTGEGMTRVDDVELDLHVRNNFTDHADRARQPDDTIHSEQSTHQCLHCRRKLVCWTEWKISPAEYNRRVEEYERGS